MQTRLQLEQRIRQSLGLDGGHFLQGHWDTADSNGDLADVPFEFCKLPDVGRVHGGRRLGKEIGKPGAELRDTWCLRRMHTNEACSGFSQRLRSEQPSGCREFGQQSVDETLPIISLMHDQTLFRAASSNKLRCQRANMLHIAMNHCIAETQLSFSERRHGALPSCCGYIFRSLHTLGPLRALPCRLLLPLPTMSRAAACRYPIRQALAWARSGAAHICTNPMRALLSQRHACRSTTRFPVWLHPLPA